MKKTAIAKAALPPKVSIAQGQKPVTAAGRSKETTSEGYPMTLPKKKTDNVKRLKQKMPKGSGY